MIASNNGELIQVLLLRIRNSAFAPVISLLTAFALWAWTGRSPIQKHMTRSLSAVLHSKFFPTKVFFSRECPVHLRHVFLTCPMINTFTLRSYLFAVDVTFLPSIGSITVPWEIPPHINSGELLRLLSVLFASALLCTSILSNPITIRFLENSVSLFWTASILISAACKY